MLKRLALITATAAAAVLITAPAASADQVLVGVVPDPKDPSQWCGVYLNTNTGVQHTKCGPKIEVL